MAEQKPDQERPRQRISRRKLITGGAAATAALPLLHRSLPHQGLHDALGGAPAAAAASGEPGAHNGQAVHGGPLHASFRVDDDVDHLVNGFDPTELLRDFDYGEVTRKGGQTVRSYTVIAEDRDIEIAPGVFYPAWTYNGRVPGPTFRATEGDRIRIRFINGSSHPHSMHFHGIHRASMDGMPGVGEAIGGGLIETGKEFTYEFDAEPFGCHLYHCHVSPLATHIARGLYGAFIIDPPKPRPKADEMVMVMNGFDTNFDGANEIYAVNTVGFHYQRNPIKVKRDQLLRIFLVNVLEYDLINSFHVHATFFQHYPTGTSLEPNELTDTVIQGQGQRAILEMRFPFPGRYMFHAHVTEFAELGWTGFFEVE